MVMLAIAFIIAGISIFRDARTLREKPRVIHVTCSLVLFVTLCAYFYLSFRFYLSGCKVAGLGVDVEIPEEVFMHNYRNYEIIHLNPDEKHEIRAIFQRGRQLNTPWQILRAVTDKSSFLLDVQTPSFSIGGPLKFRENGSVINARFLPEDAAKLTDIINRDRADPSNQ